MGAQELHLHLIMIQHPLHVARDVIHVDGLLSIGQHINCTVIARNNHKRAAVIGIEHVVVGQSHIGTGSLGMDKRQLSRCRRQDASLTIIQELQCLVVCVNNINTGCADIHRHHGTQ